MKRITPQKLSGILVDFLGKFSYQDDVCLPRSDMQNAEYGKKCHHH